MPLILKQLDTIADFVAYLEKKETLFLGGLHITAAAEEEILAQYLKRTNTESEHDFIVPFETATLSFERGSWTAFQSNLQRIAQIKADEISYYWDQLIEKFTFHAVNGSSLWQSEPGLETHEAALRFMAKEPRLRRRYLSDAFFEIIRKTPLDSRATRVCKPYLPGQPYYVFLLLPRSAFATDDMYREARRNLLMRYCFVMKGDFPDAGSIVGIATETGLATERSEDLVCAEMTDWSASDQLEAESLKRTMQGLGFLAKRDVFSKHIEEYPSGPISGGTARPFKRMERLHGGNRNSPCPCGSKKKYKKCCGFIA